MPLAARPSFPLYREAWEHDSCGVGFIANVGAQPSHSLVARALVALSRLAHRGASGSSDRSVDGAGVLTAIPWRLIEEELPAALLDLSGTRMAGMFFLPPAQVAKLQPIIEQALVDEQWDRLFWRAVPVDPDALGANERGSEPAVWQVIGWTSNGADAERRLYRARLAIERQFSRLEVAAAVVSLSTRTMVYKALAAPDRVPLYYPDLTTSSFESAFAIFHQRFSTNTFPRWDLVQPFRVIAHNGEIATIAGNRLWARARQADASSLGAFPLDAGPLVRETGSDSQSLDDAADLLRQGGLSLDHALSRLIPPAWERNPELSDAAVAFHAYQECFADPWEGPAAIAFGDGRVVGALLDRSGFRPARYIATHDGHVCVGSEVGIFDVPERLVSERGRLGPGEMILVDLEQRTLARHEVIRERLATARPYHEWIGRSVFVLDEESHGERDALPLSGEPLVRAQLLFGYTREELELILRPMLEDGKEAIGSMGDDTPVGALATRARLLPDFFRQRFAQVTSPPIDALREPHVTCLRTLLGTHGNALDESACDSRLIVLESPVLTELELERLTSQSMLQVERLGLGFAMGESGRTLQQAIETLVEDSARAIERGAAILVLSDRSLRDDEAAIPPLLATAAVHRGLIERGVRLKASLVIESGETRDAHQLATLFAFGASAVCPYLAYATVESLVTSPERAERAQRVERATSPERAKRREEPIDPSRALEQYRHALEQGLLKILSKMGVCTFSGYCGGGLMEILGLDATFAATYFGDTPSSLGGFTLEEVEDEAVERAQRARASAVGLLPHHGRHTYRRDGEVHAYHPALVKQFHKTTTGSVEAYQEFSRMVHARQAVTPGDLVTFKAVTPRPLNEVEPSEEICRRFFASAMSIGALGSEAHRTIAVAMNRIGGRSNSGEGGEAPERYRTLSPDATENPNSTTKQVASARFGVTPAYLSSATELQIKMAQGSKPGEGGQLPAVKVSAEIARLRHAQPGIALISPPPHHDIYSIEDLAQLIYDLKAFHPTARINVKLVSQSGVGIVAAGVAKAGADAIQISGHSGGTGASPRSSIKHAGMPWELGIAEAHQVLTLKRLRDRVVLQTDGGFQTGRDVALAAALGAEEYGFGTATLVALGCVMARQCHLDTCPAGIATQRPELRQKFSGTPEMLIAYLRLVAEEVRTILAGLGLSSLSELIGRADLLVATEAAASSRVDVSSLLVSAPMAPRRLTAAARPNEAPAIPGPRDPRTFNARILEQLRPILGQRAVRAIAEVRNTDRAIGASLAAEISARHGDAGIPDHPVTLECRGSAGQSFGAFSLPGLHFVLTGDANDGLGKSMHGGSIVVRPPRRLPTSQVLVGNAALYGATGGRVFIAGGAGERFAVRNSGATAVVERIGDHGCEYMTAGLVIVLGEVGRNFGAGMTGGRAYVYDEHHSFERRMNTELVECRELSASDERDLLSWILAHHACTNSAVAREVLAHWPLSRTRFLVVGPKGTVKVEPETIWLDPLDADVERADTGHAAVWNDELYPVPEQVHYSGSTWFGLTSSR